MTPENETKFIKVCVDTVNNCLVNGEYKYFVSTKLRSFRQREVTAIIEGLNDQASIPEILEFVLLVGTLCGWNFAKSGGELD